MTIIFKWSAEDLEHRIATCEWDGVRPYIFKYFSKRNSILEAGCGDGRWVKYLKSFGWDIIGLEFSKETVNMVREIWPDVEIIEGDAACSPFEENQFDGVISLGVIEHWEEGPDAPLKDIYRILKNGGIGIITVPCFNTVRRIKKMLWWN